MKIFDGGRGDFKCKWCDAWLSGYGCTDREKERRQKAHEKSLTCTAIRNRIDAEESGLTRVHFREFPQEVARVVGIECTTIWDTYENRGWGRIRKGSSKYLPTWFVLVCEQPELFDREEDTVTQKLNAMTKLISLYAKLVKPALTDDTYRNALEAAARVGGWRAVYKMARKNDKENSDGISETTEAATG